MPHLLESFCNWLGQTAFSQVLQDVEWIVPAVQTIHILAIGAVISSALVINLRVFGLLAREQPLATFAARFIRVIWWALPVLLTTGALLISAEPARSIGSPAFQLKMLLLICVCIVTFIYQRQLIRVAEAPSRAASGRPRIGILTATSMVLWLGIIVAGRWIAYASGQ